MPGQEMPVAANQAPAVQNESTLGRKVLAGFGIVGLATASGLVANQLMSDGADEASIENIASGDEGEACVTNLNARFYAEETTGNRFGPAASAEAHQDANVAFRELIERICTPEDDSADPMLLVGLNEPFGLTQPGTMESRDQAIKADMEDQTKWNEDALWLVAAMSQAELSLVQESGVYYTLYAVPGQNEGRPAIYQSQEDMTDKTLLKFTYPDGREVLLKLDCGFQPVSMIEFPGVPHLPETPEQPETPGSNPPSTGTTVTTRPSVTTTTVGDKINGPRPTTPNENPDTTVTPIIEPATPDDNSENPVGGTSTTVRQAPSTTTPSETTPTTKNPPSTQVTAPQG